MVASAKSCSHSDKVKTETRVFKDRGKNYRTTITYLDGYKYEVIAPTGHDWGEWKQRSTSGESTYWLRVPARTVAQQMSRLQRMAKSLMSLLMQMMVSHILSPAKTGRTI